MYPNDPTYQGTAQITDFCFKSPLALWADDYDQYEHTWKHLSQRLKTAWSRQKTRSLA